MSKNLLKYSLITCIFIFAITLFFFFINREKRRRPTGLTCEFKRQPLGIESRVPEFGWIVNSINKNDYQVAYQILVASNLSKINSNIGNMWDSGKIISDESINVKYQGKRLSPKSIYYWKVRTWNKNDEPSPYSSPQMFVTGIWGRWQAKWIKGGEYTFMRKKVSLPEKEIQHAIAFVTARDEYKLYINGRFIGMGPARSYNGKHPYNTYDVTKSLSKGRRNILSSLVHRGEFAMQLEIFYNDRSQDAIITDNSWKVRDGEKEPYEHIDARQYPYGWKTVNYDDSTWNEADVGDSPNKDCIAQMTYPVVAYEISPIKVINKGNGNYFFDFGKEILGGLRLTFTTSKPGHKIEIRLGEELLSKDTVKYILRTGNRYQEFWTLAEGKRTLEHYGYRAFRYGEILNAPSSLDARTVKAIVIHYPFNNRASYFTSSDRVLNDVWKFCKYSIKATALDVYQDCPTRERLPYEGDAYIQMLSHYCVDNEVLLQRYSMEYLFFHPTWPLEYQMTSILMAWQDYLHTGNKNSLKNYYGKLKEKTYESCENEYGLIDTNKLVKFPDILPGGGRVKPIVDWPPNMRDGYDFKPVNTVVNAFYYKAIALMAKIAEVLGNSSDKVYYTNKARRIKSAINTHLFNGKSGLYLDAKGSEHSSLHANMFPLAFGIVPEDKKKRIVNFIKKKGMVCNVYGAQFMLEALYEANEGGYALSLMRAKEGNSWGHMLNQGATITTETWDWHQKSNMSWAHPWGTAPANIIPRRLFGIQPLEPGYKKILIKPQVGNLSSGSIDLPTLRGNIHIDFKQIEGTSFSMNVDVPVNTTARVYLPKFGSSERRVDVDGNEVSGLVEGDYIYIDNLGSGSHKLLRESK